jgi:hypothetical protein
MNSLLTLPSPKEREEPTEEDMCPILFVRGYNKNAMITTKETQDAKIFMRASVKIRWVICFVLLLGFERGRAQAYDKVWAIW